MEAFHSLKPTNCNASKFLRTLEFNDDLLLIYYKLLGCITEHSLFIPLTAVFMILMRKKIMYGQFQAQFFMRVLLELF